MDPPTSDLRLGNLLAVAALGLTDRLHELGPEVAGVDAAAAAALVALVDFSPHGSLRRLSQVLGLPHSGAVRLVDRLAEAGLVSREAGQDDRSRAVVLTRQGRSAAQALRRQRRSATAALLEGLDGGQRAVLTRACEVLIANLTRQRLAQRAAGRTPYGGALCRWCDFGDCGRRTGDCPAASAASAKG
ncbi:MAG: MarR family transcriptional regulator [bacterium]|nr:MarR family transcriptional regulator [bacterium]